MNVLHEWVKEHSLRDARAVAICAAGGATLTYAALDRQIQYVVEALKAAGIGSEDRVAVVLPDGLEMAVAVLGVSAGAVCAPLNPAYSTADFEARFRQLHAKALLVPTSSTSPAKAAARAIGLTVLELGPSESDGALSIVGYPQRDITPSPIARGSDVALNLFTSGTAATPKLVPLTHRNLLIAAQNIAEVLRLSVSDRCLGVMPLFHIHGLSTLFATIVSGGAFISMPGFSTQAFYALSKKYNPTWYSAAPTIHRAVLDQIHQRYANGIPHALRLIRSASAPMPQSLLVELERAFGVPVIEAYGMTEAAPQIASNRLPPEGRKRGSVGRATNTKIRILDDQGNTMASGVLGEIAVRGDNLTSGYLDDPAANAAAFCEGWFRTGDLGYLDADGDLFVTGRLKEVINRGGEKISPRRIEETLLEHPSIAEVVVYGVPHAALGEHVAAALVLKPMQNGESAGQILQEIRDFAVTKLAAFELPQQIELLDSVPLLPTGKPNRKELAKRFASKPIHRPAIRARETGYTIAQLKIAEVISAVLRIDLPAVHDNFFQLGGHSLSATQVVSRLSEIFQITLPPQCLFERPTVAELAELIGQTLANLVAEGTSRLEKRHEGGSRQRPSSIPRRLGAGEPIPLSFAQQRVYFLNQLGASNAYTMSAPLRLTGPLDVSILGRGLDDVRRRHESLRTTFQMAGDAPVQVVSPFHSCPLEIVDLTAIDISERFIEAMRLATQEACVPFEIERGPLFRAKLLRLGEDDHVLLLTMHHIIADGWSVGVLYGELQALYAGYFQGQMPSLKELPVQYGDFAAWQRHRASDANLDGQLSYWRAHLKGLPPACSFPTDRPRPRVQSHRGATRAIAIPRPLIERLREVGRTENATLFMTCLAAFKTLLTRYNGQSDCVVGVPMANRSRPELESLIGFFASTLALRTDLSGDPTFGELLGRVRATALDAYANQDVPLERLVDELHVDRDPGRSPIFQVMFAFQNFTESNTGPHATGDATTSRPFDLAQGLTARPFRVDNQTAKFDLTLYLADAEDGMTATWQFDTDLFDESTIDRIARHFQTLLEGIATDPSRRVSELPLMSEAERQQLEIDWNTFPALCERPETFIELFERQVRLTPDALAVRCGDAEMNYRQLNALANQFGRYFQNNHVSADTLVGLCLNRSAQTIAMMLGVWKAGGAFLPLDPTYPAERTAFIVRDSHVTMLVTHAKLDSSLTAAIASTAAQSPRPKVLELDSVMDCIARFDVENLKAPIRNDGLAYVIYTSGSTGKPKGVMITHANVAHYAPAMVLAMGIVADDRYLHTASFAFSSSIRQMVVPLACGAAVVIASSEETRDPQKLFDRIRLQNVSVIDLVPSFWAGCIQYLKSIHPGALAAALCNRLRLILSASEPLPAKLPREWRHVLGHPARIINLFGQTETTGIVTVYPVPEALSDDVKTVPIGRPIARKQAYILDGHGQSAPIGVCGELCIGGAGVGRGYIHQPKLTNDTFVTHPFSKDPNDRLYRTGDLARYRADGVIEILGRLDAQIKVRGFRIEPHEVERALGEQPLVNQCAVIASEGSLVAFVSMNSEIAADTNQEATRLRDGLRRTLPEYMVPTRILFLERLPSMPNGKLDRKSLAALLNRETIAGQFDTEPSNQKPRSEVERILADVWKKVLKIDRIGVDQNFFDAGGNSLLSINVALQAKQSGLNLTLGQLYQHQTIAELAQALMEGDGGRIARANPGNVSEAGVGLHHPEPASSINSAREARKSKQGDVLVTIESLRAYGREALVRAGLEPAGAAIVTEVQLEANLRGQSTHNMVSIPRYARRIATGVINPRPNMRIEQESANSVCLDGDNGPGQWVSTHAMDLAIRKARECGMGIVTVRRSNHFGAAGQYVWQATREGLIGLCTTNGPLILAPTGGVTPTFGNNPLGVGIPAAQQLPILLDIAMSVAPRGKIGLYVAEGKPLPHGWILDRQGRPSSDLADLAAGLAVPIGGHKGYGLAMVMEVLAGVLSGAGFCADHSRELLDGKAGGGPDFGHMFMAIDPALFMPLAEFTARVDRMIEQTRGSELADNAQRILIPGEMELTMREQSLKEGVRLRHSTYRSLLSYAREAGLETPLQIATSAAGASLA